MNDRQVYLSLVMIGIAVMMLMLALDRERYRLRMLTYYVDELRQLHLELLSRIADLEPEPPIDVSCERVH